MICWRFAKNFFLRRHHHRNQRWAPPGSTGNVCRVHGALSSQRYNIFFSTKSGREDDEELGEVTPVAYVKIVSFPSKKF